jgi:peptidoglycan hydrolase-like protein with peptidoglycan-binding domain
MWQRMKIGRWTQLGQASTVQGSRWASLAIVAGLLLSSPLAAQQLSVPEPSPTATNLPMADQPVLSEGASGADVERLQTSLAGWGLYTGEIDGIYGPTTSEAVRQFQRQHNLPVDGVGGALTWQALQEPPSLTINLAATTADPQILTAMFTPLTFSQPPPPPSPLWLVLMPLVPLVGGGLTYLCHRLKATPTTLPPSSKTTKRH